jgi:hypothetical protein
MDRYNEYSLLRDIDTKLEEVACVLTRAMLLLIQEQLANRTAAAFKSRKLDKADRQKTLYRKC